MWTLLLVSTKIVWFNKSQDLELRKVFLFQILLKMFAVIFTCDLQLLVFCWVLSNVIIIRMLFDTMEWSEWQYSTPFIWKTPHQFETWAKKIVSQLDRNIFVMFLSNIIKYQLLCQHSQIFLFQYFKPSGEKTWQTISSVGQSVFLGKYKLCKWLHPF